MTREQMIERLIETSYDGMDYKALWYYFEYHQQQEFQNWSDVEIETEYKEVFSDEDDDD